MTYKCLGEFLRQISSQCQRTSMIRNQGNRRRTKLSTGVGFGLCQRRRLGLLITAFEGSASELSSNHSPWLSLKHFLEGKFIFAKWKIGFFSQERFSLISYERFLKMTDIFIFTALPLKDKCLCPPT